MIRLHIIYGLEDLPLLNTSRSLEANVTSKNNDENLGKYDDRADEGIFLGYATNSKGYRCYNKRLHRMVDSIDVKVDEECHEDTSHRDDEESGLEDEDEEQVQGSQEEESEPRG
jgi:hypothetical protein